MKVIVLNGPPRSGKDTLANVLCNHDKSYIKSSLATPLKQACRHFFGLTEDQFKTVEGKMKDTAMPIFFDKSWRDVVISMGEDYFKPTFGHGVFGRILYNRYINSPLNGKNIVIPDLGFRQEFEELIDAFGKENVHLIRLARPGCSFEIDSRDYVDIEGLDIPEHFLKNDSDLQQYFHNSLQLLSRINEGKNIKTEPFDISKKPKKASKKVKKKKDDG